jgi:hypothetical protein
MKKNLSCIFIKTSINMSKIQPHQLFNIVFIFFSFLFIVNMHNMFASAKEKNPPVQYQISILWNKGPVNGTIEVKNGSLDKLIILNTKYKVEGNKFNCKSQGFIRMMIRFSDIKTGPGSGSTLVTVNSIHNPFSFFLRDVNPEFPIYIPEYQVIITIAEDIRDYKTIEQQIHDAKLRTKLEIIESEPEESFISAASVTRDQPCPTWLGISRDARTFQINYARRNESNEWDIITPQLVSEPIKLEELNNQDANYGFVTGRGQGPVLDVKRQLENGFLPILNTTLVDEDITYRSICFVSLEYSPLKIENIKGTHYLVADHYGYGNMFTEAQMELLEQKREEEALNTEQTVLYFRVIAENNSKVPRYAWFKTIRPGYGWWADLNWKFEGNTGFSLFENDKVFCISKLDEQPLPDEEIAILLQPGQKAIFEFFIPHSPVSRERAKNLFHQSFDERYDECKEFWLNKLKYAAKINLPEKRIEEMMKAGLLHLDLVAYGNEPTGTLAPTIGVYSPIGTESSPIIQYFNSMGWNDIAKRSVNYFLDKQHDDGMIQNFGGYMVETGAALWTMGEYFRYTQDTIWAKEMKNKLLKSCEFLIKWREENKNPALNGSGYGMISGKVADPEDSYHQFMLNGYAYIGIERVSEILTNIDPENSVRLKDEAESWKQDIRISLFNAMARAPVVPLGDGSWCPTVPPWTEATGPLALYVNPGNCFSHGTFTVRDVLLGPMYLIFCEILNPWEPAAEMMLKYHTELFYQHNAAFSQPYYSRHAWLQLKQNLVKPFLETYYTTFSSLADRETYSFWEHIYHVSPHKTHEEAWFLMETRWMLYMESGDTLKLLPGIPRSWMIDGEKIELKNAWSYFGPFDLNVQSDLYNKCISADLKCDPERFPRIVTLRIPHPEGLRPVKTIGGIYNEKTESVIIKPFNGSGKVKLIYE